MDDTQIVQLYWDRNEQAIPATADKYGSYCTSIAKNILGSKEDAEECVNDTYLNTYKADGIIISTPTGSTGYSLSAGGPIISPAASMILMTPLAPHTLNTRSIVFAPEDVIEVELGEGKEGGIEKGMAYFDGAAAMPMVTGDRIRIEKSTKATRIIKINNISFLETLRKKMRNN